MENHEFGIGCENEEQKTMLEEPVTKENCASKLVLIKKLTGMSRRELGKDY